MEEPQVPTGWEILAGDIPDLFRQTVGAKLLRLFNNVPHFPPRVKARPAWGFDVRI